jgi:opacity protein-like surface antigen
MKTNVVFRLAVALAVLLSAGMHHNAQAQNTIGVHGQVGMSDIEVNGLGILDVVDPWIKPIVQYSAGITYERALGQHFSLATGAQYTSRGFTIKEDLNVDVFGLDLPVGAQVDTRLQYLEVPLQLKYYIGQGGLAPYIKAGGSAAYALDGKLQPKVNAIISWNLPAININLENDMYNRLDVSAMVGAGLQIPTNDIGAINIEVNYRHSLNDMFLDNITDIRIKSHGVSAGIGYTMRF